MTRHRTSRAATLIAVISLAFLGLRAAMPSGTYFEVTKHLEILTSVFRGVHEFYVEEPEPGTLMRAAIDAMLDELDPYTVYYPESRIEDIRFMNTGEYGGIGALVQPIKGEMTIVEVYAGYPAHEAGMKPGDIVRDVDGRPVDADMDSDAVSDLLQGESGSAVMVGIDRPYGGGRIEFEVQRTKVRIPAVTYHALLSAITEPSTSVWVNSAPTNQSYLSISTATSKKVPVSSLTLRPSAAKDAAGIKAPY